MLLKRWTLNNDPWIERNSSIDLRCKEAIICSISHAWEAREHPDPCGHQLPGSMPHALEYVIIQHAIFMPIPKFYADQIDGSRSSGILQGDSGEAFPIIPVLMKLYFLLWHLSQFMLDPEGMICHELKVFGAARCCDLYPFIVKPLQLPPSSWQLQAVFQMNSDAPQKSKLKNNPKIETGKVLESKL